MQWFMALQPLVVGAVLILAARVKLFDRHAAARARRSGLESLVGQDRAPAAYRVLGGAELLVGAVLVLPGPGRWDAIAATTLSAVFVGYLCYARIAAPGSSCGCLSTRPTPVNARSIARGGAMLLASLLSLGAEVGWVAAIAQRPLGAAVVLAELALIAALSPELDRAWLLPLRRLRVRLFHPLAATTAGFDVPLESTVQQLERSAAYRRVAKTLRSDVVEYWDEDEWRMVLYSAQYANRPASAVFAVPRLRYEPGSVRVAIVEENQAELAPVVLMASA